MTLQKFSHSTYTLSYYVHYQTVHFKTLASSYVQGNTLKTLLNDASTQNQNRRFSDWFFWSLDFFCWAPGDDFDLEHGQRCPRCLEVPLSRTCFRYPRCSRYSRCPRYARRPRYAGCPRYAAIVTQHCKPNTTPPRRRAIQMI